MTASAATRPVDVHALPVMLTALRTPRDRGRGFQLIVGADSTAWWARIPRDDGRGFHGIVGSRDRWDALRPTVSPGYRDFVMSEEPRCQPRDCRCAVFETYSV